MEMQASNENESYNKARGLPTPAKSPAVRLHINIDDKPPAQEVIRKVTQAHEVVEVDGFVFKRKRSVSHGIPTELEDLSAGSPSVPLDPAVARVVENVLGTFVQSVQSAAADGTFQADSQTGPKAAKTTPDAEDDVMFKVDLEARKAGLRAQLAAFTKKEEEWQEVLTQQDTWQHAAEPSSPQARAQPGNLPADAAHATGAEEAAFVSAGNAQGGAPAPEADDHAVQAHLADALVPAGADQSAAALVGQAGSLLPGEAGLLRKAEVEAHRKVAMQVEGLCSMVSGVEELVAKAEKHCTAMQARYHQERFRTHPHIDSPAKLIQELLKPAGKRMGMSQ
ncbi:hypothetical protein WJX82_006470 [Trebouxia sp. C0006]